MKKSTELWPKQVLHVLMYPILKGIFTGIEKHIKKSSLVSKTVNVDRRSVLMLVEDLRKNVMGCKKGLNGYMKQFVEIQQKLDQLGKKVKVLEKKRARNVLMLWHLVKKRR